MVLLDALKISNLIGTRIEFNLKNRSVFIIENVIETEVKLNDIPYIIIIGATKKVVVSPGIIIINGETFNDKDIQSFLIKRAT